MPSIESGFRPGIFSLDQSRLSLRDRDLHKKKKSFLADINDRELSLEPKNNFLPFFGGKLFSQPANLMTNVNHE